MEDKVVDVLLVEDNPDDAFIIREMLADTALTRYRLKWVEALAPGKQWLDEHGDEVEMVLLDLVLPDSRGLDTLVNVKNHAPRVPIVVLTGLGHDELGRQAIREGAQDYICKNEINTAVLENSLRFAVERHRLLMQLESKKNQLAEHERRLRRIIEKNADGIVIIDREGRLKYINPAAEQFIGNQSKDLLHHIFRNVDAQTPGPKGSIELPIEPASQSRTGDAEPIIVEMRIGEIDWQGETAFLASLRDISERRQLEKSLLIEKERLDTTLRSIADGVITTDKNGLILSINHAAQQITGWTPQQASSQSVCRLLGIDAAALEEKSRNTGQLCYGSAVITPHGSPLIVEYSCAPILDKENHIRGYVFVIRDVTVQKKITEEMIKVRRLESLGMIAGGLAHEYDNVFTVILGNISIAKKLAAAGENKYLLSMLEKSEQSAFKAGVLTNQLHNFSKGGGPFMKNGSLLRLLRQVIKEVLENPTVTVPFACKWDTPPQLWSLEFNRDQMATALWNIVKNAVEAMPNGGTLEIKLENIAVSREMLLPLESGDYVKISVTDHGQGIKEDMLPNIFDPFFTTKEKRAGMGLATAFSIIQQHQGTITAESRPGAGSTFNLYLPVVIPSSSGEGSEKIRR